MQLSSTEPLQSARHPTPNSVVPTAAFVVLYLTQPINTDSAEKQEINVR